MAQAYTPGLLVTDSTNLRIRRSLPIPGEVKVQQGQHVEAEDTVAEALIPGNVVPINLANALATSPGDIQSCMTKQIGEQIKEGELLAESKGFFGFFKTPYHARTEGVLEAISKVTGQIIIRGDEIPVSLKAYTPGEVVEVIPEQGVIIESTVAYVQGIFGIGGEAYGTITVACESPDDILTADHITSDMTESLIIGGGRMTAEAIQKAVEIKAAAVISGGIDDQDLKDVLGYDLGVAITGTEEIGTTLIITEGFGNISMASKTFQLLQSHQGHRASVNGATQIRAGVMRPEIVIPIQHTDEKEAIDEGVVSGLLEPGVNVRLIRDPYFGKIGTVLDLPVEPQVLGSGSKARVLKVNCQGEVFVVPRANVEIIAE